MRVKTRLLLSTVFSNLLKPLIKTSIFLFTVTVVIHSHIHEIH